VSILMLNYVSSFALLLILLHCTARTTHFARTTLIKQYMVIFIAQIHVFSFVSALLLCFMDSLIS